MTTYELRPSDISGAIRPLLPLTAEFKLCCKAEENMESGNAQSVKAENNIYISKQQLTKSSSIFKMPEKSDLIKYKNKNKPILIRIVTY